MRRPSALAQLQHLAHYQSPFHTSKLQHVFSSAFQRRAIDKATYGSTSDPRLRDALPLDAFAALQTSYSAPKHPVVLAHGLLGFDELHVVGRHLPAVQYWRGIVQALQQAGVQVITTSVPPSAGIEERAASLGREIAAKLGKGRDGDIASSSGGSVASSTYASAQSAGVNIIAHSMGGLDARYLISRLTPAVPIRSLTTIATPHRGSAVADHALAYLGRRRLPRVYDAMESLGLQTGAFSQLTRGYLADEFNPATPDRDGVRYFSYGAAFDQQPSVWSPFRQTWRVLQREEGANDGLVSVESSRWGEYKGTLVQVSHLDLINWTNRLKWWLWRWMGEKKHFNAVAFYLSICDMLAKEGL